MKKIDISTTFKKHLKKYLKYKSLIDEYVTILASGKPLPKSAVEHQLHGRMKGYRSCKLDNNLRLIYQITSDTIYLSDIGTHEIYESREKRLFMQVRESRNVKLAKSILENAGYSVSKKLEESTKYKRGNYSLYVDDSEKIPVINDGGSEEYVEVPKEFLSNKETREAIFLAYANLGSSDPVDVYRVVRERASEKTINWASELVGDEFWS